MTCAHILDRNTEYFHAFSLFQLCSCNLNHAIIRLIKLQGSHLKISLRYAFFTVLGPFTNDVTGFFRFLTTPPPQCHTCHIF